MIFLLFQVSLSIPNWKLAWSEEFDYTGIPDPRYWTYEVGFIRNTNKEYYTYKDPRNSRVENGHLILEAHRDVGSISPDGRPYNYTGGSINTLGLVHFLYGKFEARLKVPPGKGMWPAFWLLGINFPDIQWPMCGEVDIMEYTGADPLKLWQTFHIAGKNYPHPEEVAIGKTISTANATTMFHNYTFTWTTDLVAMYINNVKVVEYSKPADFTQKTWPYDLPFFLMANLAVGGSMGGEIDDSLFNSEVRFYIDYVRYYIDMNDPFHEESFKVLNESLRG
ncbi:hypothetical protein M9Y10_001965 [Tritrichomonas musculus]|uniref:GH16 domain-containing protein n=1 Tax=Tritrichomonas musculus TaxID=1915356 RepID=A0ABR2L8H1_9EUKA